MKEILHTLATVLGQKDPFTASHAQRVQVYAAGLGRQMGCSQTVAGILSSAALLHDIGKLHVDAAVLLKPERLTEEEFAQMKRHAIFGGQLVSQLRFHPMAVAGVRAHHERWDGAGYPDGLRATEIPMLGRIIAVADTYDACTSERPYRRTMARADARRIIRSEAGRQFDPDCVRAFFEVVDALDEAVDHLPPTVPPFEEQLTAAAIAVPPANGFLDEHAA